MTSSGTGPSLSILLYFITYLVLSPTHFPLQLTSHTRLKPLFEVVSVTTLKPESPTVLRSIVPILSVVQF